MLTETTLGSPPCGNRAHTYIHTPFSLAPGTHLDVPLSFFRFPLWSPEPQVSATGSPGWRWFGTHRPKTDRMYISSIFPVILRAFCTPDIPHTYVHPLSLSLLQSRLPHITSYTLVFASFRISLSDFMVQQNSVLCIRISRMYSLSCPR